MSTSPRRRIVGVAFAFVVAASLATCSTGSTEPGAVTTGSSTSPATATSTPPITTPTVTSTTPPPTTTVRPTPTITRTPPAPTTTTPQPPATTSCTIPSSLRGRDLETIPTTLKVVALTFDAGASDAGVAAILSTLSAEGVPATFFMTGDFVDEYPSSAKAMARYPIGNHTYSHPDLTTLSAVQVRSELRTAAARIRSVTGQDPRPYFRFPFGAVDSRTISIVNSECYLPFRWTVDTLGWQGTTEGRSVASVVSRVLGAARPGEIVLMHVGAHPKDGSTLDADALPQVISGLRAKGYSFATLTAVLPAAP